MNISQGEIWLINYEPQIGDEIRKARPGIIVSHNRVGVLSLKVVVPITHWQDKFMNYPWIVPLEADSNNGLSKTSAIDCYQIKSISTQRFIKKIGDVDKGLMREIHSTVLKVFDPAYSML